MQSMQFMKKQNDSTELQGVRTQGHDPEYLTNFVNRIRRLVPTMSKEGLKHLEDSLTYVEGLIHGDDIQQYTTYTHLTKYAQAALQEMADTNRTYTLDAYRKEKQALEEDIQQLANKKTSLGSEVCELQAQANSLTERVGRLSVQLDDINKKLEDARTNGTQKIEKDLQQKKQTADKQIQALINQKQALQSTIKELNSSLTKCNQAVSDSIQEETIVSWEPITENSEIYHLTSETVRRYYTNLKEEYSAKMGVSIDQAANEIELKCPGLPAIINIMSGVNTSISIGHIMHATTWNNSTERQLLQSILKSLRLPVYRNSKNPIKQFKIEQGNVPSSTNSILRELHLQRTAMEAVARQRIAEAELKTVIELLINFLPKDISIDTLVSSGLLNNNITDVLANPAYSQKSI